MQLTSRLTCNVVLHANCLPRPTIAKCAISPTPVFRSRRRLQPSFTSWRIGSQAQSGQEAAQAVAEQEDVMELEIKVQGMTCNGCTSRVQDTLQGVERELSFSMRFMQNKASMLGMDGVGKVEVSLATGVVSLEVIAEDPMDAAFVQMPRLVEAIRGLGFDAKAHFEDMGWEAASLFARNAGRLLDLACGRGGDILKWLDCQVGYVKGIDLSPGEIVEARKRFQEQAAKRRVRQCYEFEQSSTLGTAEHPNKTGLFDVVTCMFALHYFFADEQTLKTFLHNVSVNLKPGGFFFGTVPDGKRVNLVMQTAGTFPRFQGELLSIQARWQGAAKPFGSAYSMGIGDTVTEGHNEDEAAGSYEFLVYWTILQAVAAEVGLVPVTDWGRGPELMSSFETADNNKGFRHFNPSFKGSDPSLETASRINAAFVFQKQGAASEHLPVKAAGSVSTAFRQQKRARDPSAEQAGQPPAKTAAPSKYGLQAAQSAYSWLDEEDADDNYFS
eukprot:jgi/Astpho2/2639/Aster-06989